MIGKFAKALALASVSSTSLATSTFSLVGGSAPSGSPASMTINRAGTGVIAVTFMTKDGTARSGIDYSTVVKSVIFTTSQTTATVQVPTKALSKGGTFYGVVYYGGQVVATAPVQITTAISPPPPPPPPPTTQVCPDGTVWPINVPCPLQPPPPPPPPPATLTLGGIATATQPCTGLQNPLVLAVGHSYRVTSFGASADGTPFVVVDDLKNNFYGDGWLSYYVRETCFQ